MSLFVSYVAHLVLSKKKNIKIIKVNNELKANYLLYRNDLFVLLKIIMNIEIFVIYLKEKNRLVENKCIGKRSKFIGAAFNFSC